MYTDTVVTVEGSTLHQMNRIAEVCCDDLQKQGLATSYKRQCIRDWGTTYFVVVPKLCRLALRLSVVLTEEQRLHLVLVTPQQGHYLLDVTDRLSSSFCAITVRRWIHCCIEMKQHMDSAYWEHEDWSCLEAECYG